MSNTMNTTSVNAGVTNVLCTSAVCREASMAQNATMLKGLGVGARASALTATHSPSAAGRVKTKGETC